MKLNLGNVAICGLALAATVGLSGCNVVLGELVDPGYVALLVDSYGQEKGIENAQIFEGGRVRYNTATQQFYEYPVFFRTYSFAKEDDKDQSVNFSIGGSSVSMDLGVTYRFRYSPVSDDKPKYTRLHEFFRLYRVAPDEFNNGALRNALRDCANESASGLDPVKLASSAATFAKPVETCLANKFPQLDIKEISLLNPPRLPENMQASINRAFQSQQDAQTAVANKAKAEAEAGANKAKAEGEAGVKRVQADADAYANAKLARSITPELLKYEQLQVEKARVEKWNGQYAPTVQTPNVQLGNK